MKILITGTTGYVGNALVADLKGAHKVIATARDVTRISHEDVQKHAFDITQPEQMRHVLEEVKPDVVIHAAALPKRSHADDEVFIGTNVEGGRMVAQAVKDHSSAKLIFISSGCAFKQRVGEVISKHSEREMGSIFGRSKNLAEEAIGEVFKDEPSRLALVYPPMILHASQQQGVIPYALADARHEGAITNKVPGGHVNFITHGKLAELLVAVGDDRKSKDVQRYLITGKRFTTEAFFEKLQGILRDAFKLPCTIRNEVDPNIETMCATDESPIQALVPDFEWENLDGHIRAILAEKIKQQRVGTGWEKHLQPAAKAGERGIV